MLKGYSKWGLFLGALYIILILLPTPAFQKRICLGITDPLHPCNLNNLIVHRTWDWLLAQFKLSITNPPVYILLSVINLIIIYYLAGYLERWYHKEQIDLMIR